MDRASAMPGDNYSYMGAFLITFFLLLLPQFAIAFTCVVLSCCVFSYVHLWVLGHIGFSLF
jgi:hypothetical protein